MEIRAFFLFFLTTESFAMFLFELRAQSPIRVNDADLRVIGELSEFEEFFRSLQVFSKHGYFYEVKDKLNTMTDIFMRRSSVYITQLLREYCELAIEMLDRVFEDTSKNVNIPEKIRFLDEHDYCVITAIYEWEFSIHTASHRLGLLLERLFFLQTIDPDTDRHDLEIQLRLLHRKYDLELKRRRAGSLQRSAAPPDSLDSLEDYRDALTVIENKITNFSHKYCSRWEPFVRHYLLRAETQLNDVHNQSSPYVRNVFHHEICKIKIRWSPFVEGEPEIIRNPKPIDEAENHQYRIDSWNCEKILDSKVYRYPNYKEGVITRQPRTPSNPMSFKNYSLKKEIIMSLDVLKSGLILNSYYLNVVAYYNIMADVMLLVSIREGNTMLMGIKLKVQENYIEKTDKQCVRKMRLLRSMLFKFKSVFNELIFLIENKKHIIVQVDPQMKLFEDRVNSVMQLLNIQNDQIKRIYSEIPTKLKDLKGDAYLTDDWKDFEAFYFTESTLNITKLYAFSANNF